MQPTSRPPAQGPLRRFVSRRAIVLPVGAVALAAGAFALFGPARSTPAPAPERAQAASLTVNTVSPVATTFVRSIAATGTVAARDELVVGSDATGVRLLEVLADVGTTVKRGQLLARGDDAQLRTQLAQQDALIRQAQAELTQAQANLERAERIRDAGVYSAEAVQTRQTAATSAGARLELALAQKRELEIRIGHTRVLAPADGVISRRAATVGAVVQQGSELFRLIKDGRIEWLAELPSHSIVRVQPGASARVFLDDGAAIDATVRLVAPTMDPVSRNGLVHVQLPAGARLKAGAHARGEILLDNAQALALPEASVLTRDGYPFVYVVGDDGVARQTRIETGARSRGLVEVAAGLHGTARVVTTGAGFVKDGDRVRLASEPARPAAAADARGIRAGGQS
jgi:RND family efflux transporter MFP subunit